MILDKQLEFSNAQAITVTAPSTNVVDLGPKNGRGMSGSGHLPIEFTVGTTFAAAGAATLTIQIRTSDSADMSGATVIEQSQDIAVADLAAGKDVAYYPTLPVNTKRYVDINYVVATGPFTAGTISARGAAAQQIGG
ncbi:Bbp16 family capsid cement protein [Microvirga sp. G4-2]|uniref:Bbp16 family capsid cement protein n=1 Tax=Microvirga sp. G4-2 TaxID=3434467 RepID=UPI004043D63C